MEETLKINPSIHGRYSCISLNNMNIFFTYNVPHLYFSAIFERLRNVLHEGQIDTRVQYMVEVMFAIRKDGFKVYNIIKVTQINA